MRITKAMVVRRNTNGFVRVFVSSEVTGGRSVGPVAVVADLDWGDYAGVLVLTEREENLARAILEGRTAEAIDPAGRR